MKISRKLAHKLQNLIQTVMGYIDLRREEKAKAALHEMSRLIHDHTGDNIGDCDDCQPNPGSKPE